MAIKCPKCHTDNPSDSKYCKECATPIHPPEKASISETRTLRTPAKESNVGEIIYEKYKILEELGKGGMGVVYKVEHCLNYQVTEARGRKISGKIIS